MCMAAPAMQLQLAPLQHAAASPAACTRLRVHLYPLLQACVHTALTPLLAVPPPPCSPPIDLRFDRPFVFDIVHDATGLALFVGDIYKPETWEA